MSNFVVSNLTYLFVRKNSGKSCLSWINFLWQKVRKITHPSTFGSFSLLS